MRKVLISLTGLRPIMFDRYAGDNKTKLPPEDRMYLDSSGNLILPTLNVFSLMCAENTKSVVKMGTFGKAGKAVAMGIAGYVSIAPDDIPLLDGKGDPIKWTGKWTPQIYLHEAVARLKDGIPNAKRRPTVACPWQLRFTATYADNPSCTFENFRQALTTGGAFGLGTFRPYFGRYEVTTFEEE